MFAPRLSFDLRRTAARMEKTFSIQQALTIQPSILTRQPVSCMSCPPFLA